MSVVMKFIRTTSLFNNGNGDPTGNGMHSTRTTGRQPRSRQIPPPLQLGDQALLNGGNNNSNNTESTRENTAPDIQPHRGLLRRMSETASQFPFYHSFLTEEQEEEVFKDHLFKTGSYLMRDSKSNIHAITMSVVIDPLHLYHFQVVQGDHHYHVVGKGKQFPTLDAMIEYYQGNNIPGKTDDPVFLRYPVISDRNKSSPTCLASIENGRMTPKVTSFKHTLRGQTSMRPPPSPQHDQAGDVTSSQLRQRQPSLPRINEPLPEPPPHVIYQNEEAAEAAAAAGAAESSSDYQEDTVDPINYRPPLPIPRPSSVYARRGHIYSDADQPDLDRIKMVLELCRQSDMMHASRKKCTCGLYLEESTLTQGWMMHVDNEPGKTKGRIFFLDKKSNTTTWSLPEEVETELKDQFPVKWEFVQKQMTLAKRRSSADST